MRLPKLRFWNSWDDRQKANAIKWTGAVIALFALFTLLSMVSYLFTWKQDQSLLRDPAMMDQAVGVANFGGKLGLKWADLLIFKWFGLGSFAFLILLFAMAVRLLAGRWHRSLLKTAAVTLSGALIASLVFAFIGRLLGMQTLFGAGPGGECGSHVTGWFTNLLGPVVTGVLLVILTVGWLILSSRRFSKWFGSLGASRDGDGNEEEEGMPDRKPLIAFKRRSKPEEPAEPEPEPEPEPAPVPVPVIQPAVRKTVPATPPAPEETVEPEGSFEVERGEDLDTEVKKELKRIDVRLDPPEGLPSYKFPGLDLLEDHSSGTQIVSDEELNRNNNKIRSTLKNYKIEIVDVKAVVGPTVTLYKVYPAPGVKIANIRSLQDDIAMSLNARGVRIVTLPDSVGIEVANDKPSIVPLKGLLNDEAFRNSKADLPVAIGCTITKKVKVFDLADAPHLLVAGATKQGKSVGLNVLIASLLYSKHPAEMKMVFIDPKMVEFSAYGRLLKHYLAVLPTAADEEDEADSAIVKKPKEAEKILRSLCTEMDERYGLLSKAFVNNIKLYNERYKDRKLNSSDLNVS